MTINGIEITQAILDRFWSKVDKTTNCWNWKPPAQRRYGRFIIGSLNGKKITIGSHKFSYLIHFGELPPNKQYILHKPVICHNSICCNPFHLKAGDLRENRLDMHLDKTFPSLKGRKMSPEAREKMSKSGHGKHCGELHGRHKLTALQVAQIRKMYSTGSTVDELIIKFNSSSTNIRGIINGSRWKHVK